MVQKCNKVQPKYGKVTQNMHGASRNYRYVWDVSRPREDVLILMEKLEELAFLFVAKSSSDYNELG